MVRKLKESTDINSLINAVSNRIDELENEEVMDEGLLTETEDEGSMNSLIRAVSRRINELEDDTFVSEAYDPEYDEYYDPYEDEREEEPTFYFREEYEAIFDGNGNYTEDADLYITEDDFFYNFKQEVEDVVKESPEYLKHLKIRKKRIQELLNNNFKGSLIFIVECEVFYSNFVYEPQTREEPESYYYELDTRDFTVKEILNPNKVVEGLQSKEEFEFDGYEFDPNSPWTEIWDAVISPIIDSHFNHVGIGGYTQQEAEDDIDAKINIFCEEFLDYPNVVRACNKFFYENDI